MSGSKDDKGDEAATQAVLEPQSERKDGSGVVAVPTENHSIYTKNQKRALVVTAALTAFLTPLSSSIYLPALNAAARSLNVTSTQINLTVTTYLIFQGVSPSLLAGFSDSTGRKPVYIICFIIFLAANVGLGLQNNYAALLVLRALQSAGASLMVPLCSGVIADVTTSAERGSYMAFGFLSNILGPTLAPVIGGLLSQYIGWKSTFWFMAIFALPLFIVVLLFLPETSQRVVGNGLYQPPLLLHKSITNRFLMRRWLRAGLIPDPARQAQLSREFKLSVPNPVEPLAIIFTLGPGLLTLFNGFLLAIHFMVLTSFPFIFQRLYNLSEIDISLMYLPYGVGSTVSSFTTGRFTDWNYRRHAKKLGFPLEKSKQLDLSHFPIEQARLEVALPMLYVCCAMLITYGWTLNSGPISLAAPAVITFFAGWCIIAIYQVTAVLLIDMYPESPTTATAARTLVQCLLGAGSSALVIPMIERLGLGWTFTLAALLAVLLSPICFLLMRKGPQWRRAKKARLEERKTRQRETALEKGGMKERAREQNVTKTATVATDGNDSNERRDSSKTVMDETGLAGEGEDKKGIL